MSSPRGSEVEIPWDPAIELNVANLDSQKSMADQKWLPAQLRIFLDKSDEHRTYRLTVCRGNSHLTEHISKNGSSPSAKEVQLTMKQFSQLQLGLCSTMHSRSKRQRFGLSIPSKEIFCASLPRIVAPEALKVCYLSLGLFRVNG